MDLIKKSKRISLITRPLKWTLVIRNLKGGRLLKTPIHPPPLSENEAVVLSAMRAMPGRVVVVKATPPGNCTTPRGSIHIPYT